MVLVERKKKGKKRVRKKPRSYKKLETVDVYDGDVQLFRSEVSGKVWQFQMWISDDHKYFRKSTKRRNLEEAIVVAKEYYLDTQTKIRNDTPVFPKSAEELGEEYLEHKKKDVGHMLTNGRWMGIRTHIKHWLEFVGSDTKMNDIKKSSYDDYYFHRRSMSSGVKNGTLIAERGTIRAVYKYAIDRGMIHYLSLPSFPPLKKGKEQRRLIDVDEYRTIYQCLRSPEFLKDCDRQDQIFRRQLLYLTLVLANTGMRIGECRRLLWGNILKIHKSKGKKRSQWSVEILLDADQTKNKKERKVQGRRGDVFVDLRKLTDFISNDDPVFADFDTGEHLLEVHKHKIYNHWNEMLKITSLDKHKEPPTFYHLRHFYATQRLLAGVRPYFLKENMGCSLKYLEDHYGHVDTSVVRKDLLKSASYDDDGVLIVDA